MPFKIPSTTGLDIFQNGNYEIYEVPTATVIRLLNIGCMQLGGTYNINHFFISVKDEANVIAYLDSTQNRGANSDVPLGHLNGWLMPGWKIWLNISNFALQGFTAILMWYEVRQESDFETYVQDVKVTEQPIETKPRLWPLW